MKRNIPKNQTTYLGELIRGDTEAMMLLVQQLMLVSLSIVKNTDKCRRMTIRLDKLDRMSGGTVYSWVRSQMLPTKQNSLSESSKDIVYN
jgi:hypothetical protein